MIYGKFVHVTCLISGDDLDGGIPMEIFKLQQLEVLELQYQAIRFVPSDIGKLKNLQNLSLDNCILLGMYLKLHTDEYSSLKCYSKKKLKYFKIWFEEIKLP